MKCVALRWTDLAPPWHSQDSPCHLPASSPRLLWLLAISHYRGLVHALWVPSCQTRIVRGRLQANVVLHAGSARIISDPLAGGAGPGASGAPSEAALRSHEAASGSPSPPQPTTSPGQMVMPVRHVLVVLSICVKEDAIEWAQLQPIHNQQGGAHGRECEGS